MIDELLRLLYIYIFNHSGVVHEERPKCGKYSTTEILSDQAFPDSDIALQKYEYPTTSRFQCYTKL